MANFKAPCKWCKLGQLFATELQTTKATQYTGGSNFFVPDINKLPYSLCSQGDNLAVESWVLLFLASSQDAGWAVMSFY